MPPLRRVHRVGDGDAGGDLARAHFRQGVKAYDSADYERALAEFRAAYDAKPSPGILRNIGLSLRGLHRDAEAMSALEALLEADDGSLSPEARRGAEQILRELASQVATLRGDAHHADPKALAGVRMTLDGKPISIADLVKGVRIAPGLHVIGGGPPGSTEPDRSLSAVAGQTVTLDMRFALGTLLVQVDAPLAEIAIDGLTLPDRGAWSGVVPVGMHAIHVSAIGYVPYDGRAEVRLGQSGPAVVLVHLPLLANPGEAPTPLAPKDMKYFLVAGASVDAETLVLSNAFVGAAATAGSRPSLSTDVLGATFTAAFGRRLGRLFALELLGEVGAFSVRGLGTFSLVDWVVAPELRIHSDGAFAVYGGLGVGLEGELTRAPPVSANTAGPAGLIEAGASLSLERVFFELGGFIDAHEVSSENTARGPLNLDTVRGRLGLRVMVGWKL